MVCWVVLVKREGTDVQKKAKKNSATGNRTPITRVTGGYTDHYTIAELLCSTKIKPLQRPHTTCVLYTQAHTLQTHIHCTHALYTHDTHAPTRCTRCTHHTHTEILLFSYSQQLTPTPNQSVKVSPSSRVLLDLTSNKKSLYNNM